MKTLFIPSIGDVLVLNSPWTFWVHHESRNFGLLKHLGRLDTETPYWRQSGCKWMHTLKAGARLRVERIYIRKNLKEFDSITFRLLEEEANPVKGVRFWVKLDDANQMNCYVESLR